jgi:hypothetical protein
MKRTVTVRMQTHFTHDGSFEYKYTAIGEMTTSEFDEEVVIITGSKTMESLMESLRQEHNPLRVASVHITVEK